ncbi:hypothetical protein UF75_3237 [Desulfosporosinus sp. I2]|uniref:hypothetical protein n=1 Tax=Desulfosporosinus sp. I2 TaxID=1617025 RepID=UPI00061F7A2F|nr:hypothetical protein [Desulfosporosinus sp. I2]KJR46370.1 hypothetical protein UF75_3237 [Desulfosporosinus sp. I2]
MSKKKSIKAWIHGKRLLSAYGISGLPKDEKKYFINKATFYRPFDITLSKWAKNV